MKLIFTLLVFSFASAFSSDFHSNITIISLRQESQSKNYLVISVKNEKDWHSYWENPGESGLPWKFTFSVEGKDLTDQFEKIYSPFPTKLIEEGDITVYGLKDEYYFLYRYNQSVLKKHLNNNIEITAEYLICKDKCIPVKKLFYGTIKNKYIDFKFDENKNINNSTVTNLLLNAPKEINLSQLNLKASIYLDQDNLENNYLVIHFPSDKVSRRIKENGIKYFKNHNLLYPYPLEDIYFGPEIVKYDHTNKTTYSIFKFEIESEVEPIENSFKFLYHNLEDAYLDLKINSTNLSSLSKSQLQQILSLASQPQDQQKNEASGNILFYLIFAFIGGFILNFMPCVLPVISLKLFGLIVHSDESKAKIVKHNMSFSLGILATMLVLSVITVIIKSTGELIGWGFQLQSPIFVFVMMIVIFLITLNLFGLYEFATPGGKVLGNTEIKKGFWGDFISGVIAVILSTPCSAPFLGSAVSFAFTTSGLNIFLIFTFIGLGLASPFLLTAAYPSIVKKFPRPGMWMENLKKILGLSMLLTFIWLRDIFNNQVDIEKVGLIIDTFFSLLFFCVYFPRFIKKLLFIKKFFYPIPLIFLLLFHNILRPELGISTPIKTSSINWNQWSEENLMNAKGITFVDFTAKWCLTCKVNKKVVFESSDFKQLVQSEKLTLLRGDWTKKDPDITKFMNSYKAFAVPAYFIKDKNGNIHYLGETISINKIKNYL